MILDIQHVRFFYKSKKHTPRSLIIELSEKCRQEYRGVVQYLLSPEELEPYFAHLDEREMEDCPLYGVPFMVSMNADIAGIPTILSEQGVAYIPHTSDRIVQQMIDAGAIPLGKAPAQEELEKGQQNKNFFSYGVCSFWLFVDDMYGSEKHMNFQQQDERGKCCLTRLDEATLCTLSNIDKDIIGTCSGAFCSSPQEDIKPSVYSSTSTFDGCHFKETQDEYREREDFLRISGSYFELAHTKRESFENY